MSSKSFVQIQGQTDVGCVRSGNEDCFIIQTVGHANELPNPSNSFAAELGEDLFFAVSDGMGGAAAGELASHTAITAMTDFVQTNRHALLDGEPEEIMTLLEKGVHQANKAILAKAEELQSRRGMGATLTAAYLRGDCLYLLQIGDSRAYVLREGRLVRITRDQSFVGQLVEMGTITEAQAMTHPQRSVILQAMGAQDQLRPDYSFQTLCAGDLVIVCSDGLHSEFLPERLEEFVLNLQDQDTQTMVSSLVEAAKQAGGKDNITVIVCQIGDEAAKPQAGEHPGYHAFHFHDRDMPVAKSPLTSM